MFMFLFNITNELTDILIDQHKKLLFINDGIIFTMKQLQENLFIAVNNVFVDVYGSFNKEFYDFVNNVYFMSDIC